MSVITPLPFEAPAPAEALVPTWPRIVATVGVGGVFQVAIDEDAHPLDPMMQGGVKQAIETRVIEYAQHLGRTVRMDVANPSGTAQFLVTPAGEVTTAAPGAPATHQRPPEVATDHGGPAPSSRQSVEEQWALPLPTPEPATARDHHEPATAAPAPTEAEAAAISSHQAPAVPAQRPTLLAERALDAGSAPTLADLLGGRTASRPAPAQQGWRAGLRAVTGGAISPRPGRGELARLEAAAAIARPLDGPKTVVVVNPKGGAHKTTAALLLAANLGRERGGYTLAWDNNETRGTMGWRAAQGPHTRTAINLLADLDRFEARGARVGDLDAYVRAQRWGHFDVLASDEDANSADLVDGPAFERLHATLARFYRVMVVDTGNNMRAPNWSAALAAADQLVIVSTIREDTSQSAAWLADALAATGHGDLITGAVTVLTAPARNSDSVLAARLHEHFSHLTRTVLSVPHDPSLVAGGPIDYAALTPASRDAWLRVTAAVTDGL